MIRKGSGVLYYGMRKTLLPHPPCSPTYSEIGHDVIVTCDLGWVNYDNGGSVMVLVIIIGNDLNFIFSCDCFNNRFAYCNYLTLVFNI